MNLKYVLFDLDGTIADTCKGVTESVAYSLKKFGIRVDDINSLRPFIGPPLSESFSEFYGFQGEKLFTAQIIDPGKRRFGRGDDIFSGCIIKITELQGKTPLAR